MWFANKKCGMPMKTEKGSILKEAREKAGLTQAKLGEIAGYTEGTVRNAETAKKAPSDRIFNALLAAIKKHSGNPVQEQGAAEKIAGLAEMIADLEPRAVRVDVMTTVLQNLTAEGMADVAVKVGNAKSRPTSDCGKGTRKTHAS